MPDANLSEEILRRLLVTKYLLVSNLGQLTPHSDPLAVARMVLTAHDAAELGAAALASHLGVRNLPKSAYLMDYVGALSQHSGAPLAGTTNLSQLNTVRNNFKHQGILPEVRSWYRVVESIWGYVDQWCRTHLNIALEDIDLETLLADEDVRVLYQDGKAAHLAGNFKGALESLGVGLVRVLSRLPGIPWPVVIPARGSKNAETALMLSAYGVRPSDFLGLQEFLPRATQTLGDLDVKTEWNERDKGHRGNWTHDNVQFCLDTFLDLALKVQHAPPVPRALSYSWIFDDIATPKGDKADLFEYEFERGTILTPRAHGRRIVRVLRRGESLRCRVSPSNVAEGPPEMPATLRALVQPTEPTNKPVLALSLYEHAKSGSTGADLPVVLYVDADEVNVSSAPKDDLFVRQMCPHLFEEHPESG